MFDIGFWEICLIAVIALLVVGPERLPKVAYEAGKWFAKVQRFVRGARMELERELHNYEIKQTLTEQKNQFEEISSTVKKAGQEFKKSIEDLAADKTATQQKSVSSKSEKNQNEQ